MIKEDINGAAACMQGYLAREGLGITLRRNHRVAARPARKANFVEYRKFFSQLISFMLVGFKPESVR